VLGAMNAMRYGRPLQRVEDLGTEAASAPGQLRLMGLGPMMHGGSQWVMGNTHVAGGVFVLYTGRGFDAREVLELAARSQATMISTIGDAMARPLAEELLSSGRADLDLSNLMAIGNGGAPLSNAVRDQLRAALPDITIIDSYGASETGSTGTRPDAGEGFAAPRFQTGPEVAVFDGELGRCGVGEVGMLARTGNIPLGYHNDPEKTASSFPVIDGIRWVIPGDHARLEDDGSVSVLGRGSVSINSGGEKIHPEEVEGALVLHDGVFDAAVVGIPSERWGEQVTALVQCRAGRRVTAADLRDHCRSLMADFKVPKEFVFVEAIPRTPVGKIDYRQVREDALQHSSPTLR
jgi:acyl-CoA synthetase (AMP-forming)/AMP-acid ligase II